MSWSNKFGQFGFHLGKLLPSDILCKRCAGRAAPCSTHPAARISFSFFFFKSVKISKKFKFAEVLKLGLFQICKSIKSSPAPNKWSTPEGPQGPSQSQYARSARSISNLKREVHLNLYITARSISICEVCEVHLTSASCFSENLKIGQSCNREIIDLLKTPVKHLWLNLILISQHRKSKWETGQRNGFNFLEFISFSSDSIRLGISIVSWLETKTAHLTEQELWFLRELGVFVLIWRRWRLIWWQQPLPRCPWVQSSPPIIRNLSS